jgi:membrane fusion protein (multidrug efflux system)
MDLMKIAFRVLLAFVGVMVVLGVLGTIKGLQIQQLTAQGNSFAPPAQTVTVSPVTATEWESTIDAVGSFEAVQGVMVSAELPGKITRIGFEPGAQVTAGQLLVQQDTSEETAQLAAAKSRSSLAEKRLKRARLLNNQNVIPNSQLDDRTAEYEQALADVRRFTAIIEKKTIRAPFSGRLGIRRVNLGQVLESGQAIVSLQAMDPIFINFQLPQQELPNLAVGLRVRASTGTRPSDVVVGKITALNPEVDQASRNITVQATFNNSEERLRPGMFTRVAVLLPAKRPVLMIPATAVLYAPYSDSVFLVDAKPTQSGETRKTLRQQFVRLGEKRGDYIAVLDGLEVGQTVVSTGVFKLRNGMPVVVDDTLAPPFELNPKPGNA